MKSEDFLDLYRQLEDTLEEKYIGKKRKFSSVVIEFLNSSESVAFRDKLNLAREIRNLLSHNAKVNGEDLITPSDIVGNSIREIIAYLNKPPLAIEFATKNVNILYANKNQNVLKVMEQMEKRGFSHVPILENSEFVGVFSKGSVFRHVLKNYEKPIRRETTIAELKSLLKIENNGDNYVFRPKDLTLTEAMHIFENVKAKNQRVSVIFITEHGKTSEKLLGMMTPLDAVKVNL